MKASTRFFPKAFLATLYQRLVIYLSFAGCLISCGKPVENSKFIPQDVSIVFSFDLARFSQKAPDWPEALNQDFPLFNLGKKDEMGHRLINSGIDFKSKAYLFSNIYTREDPNENYYALSFKLDNESNFDDFIREFPTQKLDIKSYAGLKYTLVNNKTILGWVNRVALLITKEAKTEEKLLRDALLKLRDLPESQSLKKNNEEFQRLRLSEFDMATWVNLGSFQDVVKTSLKQVPLPITLDLTQNYLTTVTNFNTGQIATEVKLYNLNESLQEYEDVIKDQIAPQMLLEMPIARPLVLLGLGLKMEGITRFYNSLGGYWFNSSTSSDILQMLNGDILAQLHDIQGGREPKYEYAISLGIDEQETLQNVLEKFVEDQVLISRDSFYYAPVPDLYVLERSGFIYLTPSDSIRQQLMISQKTTEPSEAVQLLGQDGFFTLFADVKKESRAKLPSELFQGDRIVEGIVKYTETPVESLSIRIKPIEDKISNTRILVRFKEKETNALQLLVNLLVRKPSPQPSS